MNTLLYSGCQGFALTEDIAGQTMMPELWEHNLTALSIYDAALEELMSAIKTADVIIASPTPADWRNDKRLSIEYILQQKRQEAKAIILPRMDCAFYYFDYGHLYLDDRLILEPAPMHFRGLVDCYMRGEGVDCFLAECVNNVDYCTDYTEECARQIAALSSHEESLKKLQAVNGNTTIIEFSKAVKEHGHNNLLSHTHNHPTSFFLSWLAYYLCDEIGLDRNRVNPHVSPFMQPKGGTGQLPLYASTQKHVSFDCAKYPPDFREYNLGSVGIREVAEWYIQSYEQQNLREKHKDTYKKNPH